MVLGVFTSLGEVGGVQQVGRHAGAVLWEEARARGGSCALFSLNDKPGTNSFFVAEAEYSYRGFGRQKTKLIARLAQLAPKLKVAYLGHPHLAPLGMFLQFFNRRLRYWVAAHGMEVWQPLPLVRRLGLRRAYGITAVSADTAVRMVRAQRLDPRKVFLLPPALERGFADPPTHAAPLEVPAGSRIILSVGRLIAAEPGKGFDTVIRALPQVVRQVPNCRYVIIGDGDDRERLERLAEQFAVRDRVVFAGKQTADHLKRYYAACDVFAMPSRQEGFGIVFLEAMAFGKPILAGHHGGTTEFVKDGQTGYLVEYDAADEVAARLIRLLQDDECRRSMGEAGRRWVEEHCSFEQFRCRLLRVLNGAA